MPPGNTLYILLPWKQVVSTQGVHQTKSPIPGDCGQYSKSNNTLHFLEGTYKPAKMFLLVVFFVLAGTCNTCTQGFPIGQPPSQYPWCLCVGRVLTDSLSSSGLRIHLALSNVSRLFLMLAVRGGSMWRCVWERRGRGGRVCVSVCMTHWSPQRDGECTQQISAGCGKLKKNKTLFCSKPN